MKLKIIPCCIAVGLCAATLAACAGGTSSASQALQASDSAASSAAPNPVAVSPEPGTPDASPSTQISFLGSAGTSVSSVRVSGSRSGVHAGVLRPYSTGAGASFLVSHPFSAGERVSVTATVTSAGSSTQARTSFTVAHQTSVSQALFPINAGDPHAIQHYSSAPALTPSTVHITTPARPGAAPGDLFLAPYQGAGTPGR